MSKATIFRFKYLFQKYTANTCTLAELEELFDLAGKEQNTEELQKLLEQFWADMSFPTLDEHDRAQQEQSYHKLLETIKREKKTYSFERKLTRRNTWAIAASVLVIFSAAAFFFTGKEVKPQPHTLVVTKTKPKTPVYVRVLKLSDGSTVYLNKGSHLDYPARFSGKRREVYLTGEGYFDIKHDNAHPFIVYADGVATQVLGTAFNIKADEGKVKVTVTRGKVSVTANKKLLGILLPNQQISYTRATHKLLQASVIAQSTVLWKEPDLVMDNMTLKEAAALLTERYGINVQLNGHQLDSCRFSASFLNTTQLDHVLEVLSRLNNLEIKPVDDKTYLISGPGCN